jgi:CRISPR/Cas system-associated exonuclease Cas4 (RecB family)
LNAFYQAVLEGRTLKLDDLNDVFQAQWKFEEEKTEVRYGNGESRDECVAMGKKCLEAFLNKVSLPAQVIGLEEPFSVDLGDGVPPLIGRFDLIEKDEETIVVVDFKTSKKRYSENQPNQDLQMTAYSLGIQTLFPNEQEVLLRLDVLLKQKKPDLERYFTVRDQRDRTRFIKLARGIYHAISNEVFHPIEGYSCGNCAYQDPCADW